MRDPTSQAPHAYYEHPPLVEALFEFFAPGSGSVPHETLEPLLGEIAAEYPGPSDSLTDRSFELAVEPDGSQRSTIVDRPVRRRFRSLDETRMVQVAPHMLAVNIFPPYRHYVDYLPEVENLFNRWVSVADPTTLELVGQRYINKLLLPLDANPRDYFTVYPNLPDALGHTPMALQLQFQDLSSGAVLLNLGSQGDQDGKTTYLLDLYGRSSPERPLSTKWSKIRSWMDEAHSAIYGAFEFTITDLSRRLFGED